MVVSYLPMLRAAQEVLMTDVVQVVRDGVVIHADVPARITASRLFAEPGDPHDANLRSTQEFGFTIPALYSDVIVGDTIEKLDGGGNVMLSVIAGEVMSHDTWMTAVRIWATRPKTATPLVDVQLWRYDNATQDYVKLLTGLGDPFVQTVQVVFDRIQPNETPLRYSPGGRTSYQGGTLIGDLSFDVRLDDRFTLNTYGCIVDEVLPMQPQHIEAHFVMDLSGVH